MYVYVVLLLLNPSELVLVMGLFFSFSESDVLVPANHCYLRLAQITVGMAADDFLLGKALSCRHNISDGYVQYDILQCEQPVSGQFLTILNNKYIESDVKRDEFWLSCLNLCGLKIHVTGKTVTLQ